MLTRIVSGGQTGVDIAALRAAKAVGLETGGWIPKGYRTLSGNRPEYAERYGMQETQSGDWPERTRFNVRDSGITYYITDAPITPPSKGQSCTRNACRDIGRPFVFLRAWAGEDGRLITSTCPDPDRFVMGQADAFCAATGVGCSSITNIAGTRAVHMEAPVEAFLTLVFAEVLRRQRRGA